MTTQNPGTGSLHVSDRGHGLPLVFVHGFPLDSRMWDAQAEHFSASYRTLAVDLPGFGKSPYPGPFTIESMASDLHAQLESIGALPCVLAGLSMGGYVSLMFARKFPSDLRALMLVDTKADADNSQQKEARQRMIDQVRSEGPAAVAEQMLPRLLAEDSIHSRPGVAKSVRAMMEACPAQTIEQALIAMRDRPDQTELLPSIAVPTLIIVGDHDAITPVSIARSMQERIPHAELAVIRGAGHMSPMEQPAQVNQAMSRFLERV